MYKPLLRHPYVFTPHEQDTYGDVAEQLYKKIEQWLGKTFEPQDYFSNGYLVHALVRNYREFLFDFREEKYYSLFALTWRDAFANYYNSFKG